MLQHSHLPFDAADYLTENVIHLSSLKGPRTMFLVEFFPAYAEVSTLTDRDQDGRGRDLDYFTRPTEEERKKNVNIN